MAQRQHDIERTITNGKSVTLEDRQQSLVRRLDDGYTRIDEAALSGTDVSEWESFWIRLLREYEDVCREQDLAA